MDINISNIYENNSLNITDENILNSDTRIPIYG